MPDKRDLPDGSCPVAGEEAGKLVGDEQSRLKAERQATRKAERQAVRRARRQAQEDSLSPALSVASRDPIPAVQSPADRRARNQAARAARRAERQAERAGRHPNVGHAATPNAVALALKGGDGITATPATVPFNILVIAQGGRLECEAAILAASLRRNSPEWRGRLIVAEPQATGAWDGHAPQMTRVGRDTLTALGAEILPLHSRHFGHAYPYGNKIEALSLLPAHEPFLFLDSDTLITGPIDSIPFDFARPSASMRREGTWPQPPLYGPGYTQIWRSLYDRFGVEFASSLDLSQPDEHWERYLYFNAGWFFGADPAEFGRRFLDWSVAVRDDPGEELAAQSLHPWLDQIVLPLVVHGLGGGRAGAALAGLDGDVTWHYRKLPLLYAAGPDAAVAALEDLVGTAALSPLLDGWAPWQRMVVGGDGRRKVRPLFAGAPLPAREQAIRKRLKSCGLWID